MYEQNCSFCHFWMSLCSLCHFWMKLPSLRHFWMRLRSFRYETKLSRDKSRAISTNSPKIHSKILNSYGWTSMKTIKLSQIDAFSLMIKAQTTIHLASCGCWRKTLKIIWQSSCAKDSNNTNQVSKLWKQRAKCHVIISKNAKIKWK